MAKDVRLLVGTKKGAFVYSSDETRQKWDLSDPILAGWSVPHMSADTRKEQLRFYAAANHFAWGACLQRRPGQDMGATQPDACLSRRTWTSR